MIIRKSTDDQLIIKNLASYAARVMELHDATEEAEMNTTENSRTNPPEDVIELGVASIETQGQTGFGESAGIGHPMIPGISEE